MFGIKQEPALLAKVVEEIVRAAIPMALIFGWIQWTDAQTGTVQMFIGVVTGAISLLFTRSRVVTTDKANAQILTATRMPEGTTVEAVIAKTEKDANL